VHRSLVAIDRGPATQEIQNLSDYVHKGRALVATECATDRYGGAFSVQCTFPRVQPFTVRTFWISQPS
jgi:hypothetical protein